MFTTEEGVQAIIDLQKMNGVVESPDDALKGWDNMSDSQKKSTEQVHKMMFPQHIQDPK